MLPAEIAIECSMLEYESPKLVSRLLDPLLQDYLCELETSKGDTPKALASYRAYLGHVQEVMTILEYPCHAHESTTKESVSERCAASECLHKLVLLKHHLHNEHGITALRIRIGNDMVIEDHVKLLRSTKCDEQEASPEHSDGNSDVYASK